MATKTVEVKGLKALLRRVRRSSGKLRARTEKVVTRAVFNVERKAKRLCPVDTGRLRSSIRAAVDGTQLNGEVFTNVFYAPFLEFGTGQRGASSSHPPLPQGYVHGSVPGAGAQPFLFPAWEDEREDLVARLADAMAGSL